MEATTDRNKEHYSNNVVWQSDVLKRLANTLEVMRHGVDESGFKIHTPDMGLVVVTLKKVKEVKPKQEEKLFT